MAASSPSSADANWGSFCKAILTNTDYIFNTRDQPSTLSAEAHAELLFATRANLLLAASEIGTRYNDQRPIARLSGDILFDVFARVASEQQPIRPDASVGKPGDLGWISLSHVCRRWRSVMLDMPSLWASCVCTFPSAMADMVTRAQRTPLTLDLDCRRIRASRFTAHFHMALSYVRLASNIRFAIPYSSQSALSYVLTTYDLPFAEEVELEIVRDGRDKPSPIFQPEHPPMLATRMRCCTLKNIFLPWNASELTRLELIRDLSKTHSRSLPEPEVFLATLSQFQSLRHLHIEGWVPDCTPLLPNVALHRVRLPKLQELSLLAVGNQCEHLWRLLDIPSSAELKLDVAFSGVQQDKPAVLYSLMGSLFPHIHADHALHSNDARLGLLVHLEDELTFQVHIFSFIEPSSTSTLTDRDAGPFHAGYRRRLAIRLDTIEDVNWLDGVPAMLKTCGILATAVGVLGIRAWYVEPSTVWQDFLRPFSQVHTFWLGSFTVDDAPQTGIVGALATEDIQLRAQGGSGVVLPRMRELWMRDIVLEDPMSAPGRHRASFQHKVLDALRWRAENGLECLRVSRIPTDVDEQPELRAVLKEDFFGRARDLVPSFEYQEREGRVSVYDYNVKKSWRLQ
ncbi:hypothetical protein PENSPDRAFT_759848 [Peniophora sp. CONT]|nr:hypothetical protein PENSPDRAFT_759848 [Peniophora sp. CONT]